MYLKHPESLWDHLAGAPFVAGETGEIAVEVADDRADELLGVEPLDEAS